MKARTMITIDRGLRSRAGRVAVERGVSFSRLVADALEAYLKGTTAPGAVFRSAKIRGRGPKDVTKLDAHVFYDEDEFSS
jgi:hypothetical protein